MTNQEAIQMLKSKLDGSVDTSYEWCECVQLAIKALEATDVISRKEVLELIESFKVESTHELSKSDFDRNDTLRLLQDTIKGSIYQTPSQQDIYKAVLGFWSPEDALTTVQEMNEKTKEVIDIMRDCPEKCDGCKSFKEEEHPLISLRYYLCEKTGMAIQKHIGGYLPHELTPDVFSNKGIKIQEGEADEWERVLMSGDKRAIAQYKVDHGFTMTKEEMDILEEEKKMAKYIEKEALIKAIQAEDEFKSVIKIIENMPYFVKGEISTTLEEKFDEYRSLLEECERKLSYLLDCEIESTLESQKVKELITKIQSVI